MKFGPFAAAAFLAVTAVGIATGTVHANPVTTNSSPVKEISTSGTDHGIGYHATLSDLSRVLTTVVDKGRFRVTDNAEAVALTADDGTQITRIPLTYKLSGTQVQVGQTISDDGHKLVLTPTVTTQQIGQMEPVSSMSRLATEVNQNVVGLVAGGLIGGLIGTVIGMGFFSILTGPVGLLIGALAGGAIMGGQPFMDALTSVVSGRP
jgi:outer membrane lipoprotein SlyB